MGRQFLLFAVLTIGGTAAAPPEHTNSVVASMREGLSFVADMLPGYDPKRGLRL